MQPTAPRVPAAGVFPWSGNAVQEYPVRPGLDLSWGGGIASPLSNTPSPTAVSALFLFVLRNDSPRDTDRMVLRETGRPGGPLGVDETGVFHVAIRLAETALLDLLRDDKTPGAAQVREFIANPAAGALVLPLTPGARLAVESIRRCPFAGACRAMALTARCHDLLLEFLTALSTSAAPRLSALTRSMDEQVRAAAEILQQQLEEPPAMAELARRVGLSETTLKRGFHQVFGTTAFGYLRARRMERAHALLQSGDATVLEAAALVGYSNPSNFAAAFRRQFGVNPKTFQLTARR